MGAIARRRSVRNNLFTLSPCPLSLSSVLVLCPCPVSSSVSLSSAPARVLAAPTPLDRRAHSLDRRAVPLDRRAVPLDRQAVPLDRCAVPLDRRAVPLDRHASLPGALPRPTCYIHSCSAAIVQVFPAQREWTVSDYLSDSAVGEPPECHT